ncbi:MAG TPA: glycosyltransferase family 39 protein [Vicinamibacteria bacterium]
MGAALVAAAREGWTYDEPWHVGWSRRLIEERVTERQSNPLYNSKTPALLPHALAKMAAERAGATDATALRFVTRLPSVVCLAGTLAALFLITRRWVGPAPAHLATMAAALDPNLVAHGSVATTEMPYALALLLVLGAALAFLERTDAKRAALLGLALAFAFTAKFTAFLLVPGLLVLPLLRPPARATAARMLRQAPLIVLVAWLGISAAYLFIGFGVPVAEVPWKSAPLRALAAILPGLRLPAPLDFVTGLDICIAHERERGWPVMLFGRRFEGGVWFYFLALWILKTPLALLLAEVTGAARALRDAALRANPCLRLFAWNLLVNGVYFSLLFRAQIGYRYVLMALPLLAAIAAAGLATLRPTAAARGLLLLVVASSIAEQAPYLGNPLAFTNLAVQPKRDVYRLMDNANVAWGQHRMQIGSWLSEAGLAQAHLDPVHILPGENVFELNLVTGVDGWERQRWLREHLQPIGHFGHTYLRYHVDEATFDRYLGEARHLWPTAEAGALCERVPLAPPVNGALPLGEGSSRRVWIVCIEAPGRIDLGVAVDRGQLRWGRADAPLADWDALGPGQRAWYRLEPGRHAFAATGADWRFAGRFLPPAGGFTFGVAPARADKRRVLGPGDEDDGAVTGGTGRPGPSSPP